MKRVKKFFCDVRDSISFVTPHFGLSYQNISRTIASVASFVIPIIEVMAINVANEFVLKKDKNEDTSDLSNRVRVFISSFAILSFSFSIRHALDCYIAESLKKSIKISNTKKLLNSKDKFLIGSEHLKIGDNVISLQEVTLGSRVDAFVDSFVHTTIGQSGVLLSTCANLYYITKATNSVSAISSALSFALTCGGLTFKLDKSLAEYWREEEAINSLLLSRSAFIENNRSSIALMGATDFEKEFITEHLRIRDKKNVHLLNLEFLSKLTNMLLVNGAFCFFDLLLPESLIKQLDSTDTKYINNIVCSLTMNIQRIAEIYNRKYPQLKSHLDQLEAFDKAYNNWLKVFYKGFSQKYNADHLSLKNFSVSFSEDITHDNCILHQITMNFQPAFYRLVGPSGSGKTTVLKAIMNCWPFAIGEVHYPGREDDICFIPQQVCIPPQLTLLEIIAYPMKISDFLHSISSAFEKVSSLMTEMNLTKYTDKLNTKGIYWSFILSGGEKQKVAIIGVVIKKPKLLILDEATSNLDEVSRLAAYKILKKALHDTTVIYTDHQPLSGIEDYTLRIHDHDLQQISSISLLGDI
jgi:ABC-type uncharacterized transport system fused permease/ATPase subunit